MWYDWDAFVYINKYVYAYVLTREVIWCHTLLIMCCRLYISESGKLSFLCTHNCYLEEACDLEECSLSFFVFYIIMDSLVLLL